MQAANPLCVLAALALISSLDSPLRAQGAWSQQAPLPTNSDLRAVAVVGPGDVWAAGGAGVLAHTMDGGESWSTQTLETDSLWALFFVDAQRGWAAGNGLFHTIDGGETWVEDDESGSIYDLFFLDAQRGWACGNGGVTFRTEDGGLTWSWTAVGTITTLSSICFLDAVHGFTVDIDGRIYRSADGGASWTLAHDADAYLSTLQFLDVLHGWAIGGNTFLRTEDGGATWKPVSVPPGTWSHGARFLDAQTGISVGDFGNVTRTLDGGESWVTVAEIGSGPHLWDVESADATGAFACGGTGVFLVTDDAGATWTKKKSGAAGSTHALDALDGQRAWTANDHGETAWTTNGGAHWESATVAGFDTYGWLTDVDFHDPLSGFAVGRHETFGPGAGRIVRSVDGGVTWSVQHTVPGAYMEAVEMLDAHTILALGQVPSGPRFVLRSQDGGASWADVAPSQAVYMDADFLDASTGWIVGGRIHKSVDGGLSWTDQLVPDELLYAVSFSDAQHGFAVGWGPTLLRTVNGGATWIPLDPGMPAGATVLFDVETLDARTAWICGSGGFVARTQDGGESWQAESLPGAAGQPLLALEFLDAERGWVAGEGVWRRGPLTPAAACTVRNGSGINPVAYACLSAPTLGALWTASVALSADTLATVIALGSHTLEGFPSPFGTGELLVSPFPHLLLQSGLGAHALLLPGSPALSGIVVPTQAFRLDGVPLIEALNAIDLTLGP